MYSTDDKVTEDEKVLYPWLTDDLKKAYRDRSRREMERLLETVEDSNVTD